MGRKSSYSKGRQYGKAWSFAISPSVKRLTGDYKGLYRNMIKSRRPKKRNINTRNSFDTGFRHGFEKAEKGRKK